MNHQRFFTRSHHWSVQSNLYAGTSFCYCGKEQSLISTTFPLFAYFPLHTGIIPVRCR